MGIAVMNPEYLIEVVRDTIKAVEYSFLITLSESGQANARLVQHLQLEESMALWFVTSASSRKVREIRNQSYVTVTFQDDREQAYVTVLGSASVETDSDEKQKRWREDWIVFFPAGPQSDYYVLLKFIPSRIEVMNFARHVASEPLSELRLAVLTKVGRTWRLEQSNLK